jgi:hypothetical protein
MSMLLKLIIYCVEDLLEDFCAGAALIRSLRFSEQSDTGTVISGVFENTSALACNAIYEGLSRKAHVRINGENCSLLVCIVRLQPNYHLPREVEWAKYTPLNWRASKSSVAQW